LDFKDIPVRQAGASAMVKAYKPEEIINVGEDMHWSESGENKANQKTAPNINVDVEELDESIEDNEKDFHLDVNRDSY
jgi:hypothetical protein